VIHANTVSDLRWDTQSLDELCSEITVGHVGSMASQYKDTGIPFLRSQNVEYLRIELSDVKYIGPDFHSRLQKSRLRPGDVVIVRTGKPGACAVVPDILQDANCSDLVIVRCGPRLDPRFLAYYINSSARGYVNAHLVGAVQQHFNVGAARNIRLFLPPLHEQRAIAAILGAFDNKIELNRKMSGTLEATARALFKSWFVDFDPVRAKAERRDSGLPPEIDGLFADSLASSKLGVIPAGWRVDLLGSVAVNERRSISHTDISEGTHCIGLEHMPRRCIALERWGDASGIGSNKTQFRRGEFLFGKLRPYFHKVGVAPIDGVASTDILVVRAISPEWSSFVLEHLSSDALVAHTDRCSIGTKMPRASWGHIAGYDVAIPPAALARAYNDVVSPMTARIVASIHESRTLGIIRDALLPKLISGNVRVHDAERVLEQSA